MVEKKNKGQASLAFKNDILKNHKSNFFHYLFANIKTIHKWESPAFLTNFCTILKTSQAFLSNFAKIKKKHK